jgi:hypothetical protein
MVTHVQYDVTQRLYDVCYGPVRLDLGNTQLHKDLDTDH